MLLTRVVSNSRPIARLPCPLPPIALMPARGCRDGCSVFVERTKTSACRRSAVA